ncbi:glutathione S-transferase N-terminal domain-containing protein [Acinetobacter rudis]|uniref:Glutathione S-transferase N-terminal domain-containing protein n=1 Tax=Acinetobacter rudis TaxID=632955 RepID=A0AAW8J729_9GAMM|nr:glutathione S-transferase N-terminal domain-containing protein [Acinetobacter rudis]MDQ8935555.1 glutathione S-transferase N-terminal domain-containing protein [Acinetobacter rudis]MDQ8953315.1 glutathione S-transferase N-terminal domain-containing protein [Acinetobacter rudis]MDQ9017818.1 glutathione S-transferase N-terminal domain-containing protein [Acinetobacter rudis]
MVNHHIKVTQAILSSLTEGSRGMSGTAFPMQPNRALKLYEFEGSPFCRRVREVMTLLNLDYEVYPCPKGGEKYRSVVKKLGGKMQFPFFVDENTGDQLYESQQIIQHLFKHYSATGKTPSTYRYYPKLPFVAFAGTLINGARGVWVNKAIKQREAPAELLQLWGFESSPFTRIVRALLTELELPFVFNNVAKERWQDMGLASFRLKPGPYHAIKAGKRAKIIELMGRPTQDIQVPYLVDPNTNVALFESAEIVKYLEQQYGTPE